MVFTEDMENNLVELIEANFERLNPTGDVKDFNKTKKDAWQEVHSQIVARFPTQAVTLVQVKQKWTKMKQDAKSQFKELNRFIIFNLAGLYITGRVVRYACGTGGGSPMSDGGGETSFVEKKPGITQIMQLYKNCPTFIGTSGGVATDFLSNEKKEVKNNYNK
jgi:hypothetical protein